MDFFGLRPFFFRHPSKWFTGMALFSLFSLFSLPAYSATAMFSFVEFNIAFVLGLSLPVLIITALMKPATKRHLIFPALLTLSLLGFLYSSSYLVHFQMPVALSFAVVFVALLYVWPLTNVMMASDTNTDAKILRGNIYFINAGALVYILTLWFVPQLDAFIGWGVVNLIILAIGIVIFVALKKKNQDKNLYFLLYQWVLSSFYALVMFFWLNTVLALTSVIVFAILSYLMAMINGNWSLLSIMITAKPVNDDIEQISQEDLFSFTHDPATNLPNYQQALRYINHELKVKQSKNLAVIVFKPVNFQQVNSVLGHHNSDILLLQLAYCVQQHVAENEALLSFDAVEKTVRLARLQSLHFVVVLNLSDTQFDKKSMVNDLCQQLVQSVPGAMSFKSFSLNFELAFGIAFTGEDGNNVTEVIAHATDALLAAETSKQEIHYYDHNSALFTERQLLNMERLKQDIDNDNIIWYLQPQINMNDKNIKGFELMGHWYKTPNEAVELTEFLTIAELSGDVFVLTKYMISQACQAIANFASYGTSFSVSVNLSCKDLLEPELVNYIEQQLTKHRIASKYLIIELNESVLLSADNRAKSLIDQLKSIGIGISIDHFTGSYEALRYLRKMTINQVKINCKLLSNDEENRVEKAITNALINLTRTMKLPLVGIEINSASVGELFLSMGGEITQGHAVKHGVVFDEIEIWLEQWFKQHPHARPLR